MDESNFFNGVYKNTHKIYYTIRPIYVRRIVILNVVRITIK